MERTNRPTSSHGPFDTASAPALRDAAAILARAQADEVAADQARERYRTRPMAALDPDARIGPLLAPGERVLAVRRSAMVDRREPVPGSDEPSGLAGDLYLTSRRLVLVGRHTLAFDVDEIEETLLAGDQLLLVMRGGQGAALGVDQPRLLRVEIAAARRPAGG
jgi:hypothetical protein